MALYDGGLAKICVRCGSKTNPFRDGRNTCMRCASEAAVLWAKKNRERKRQNNNAYQKRISSKRAPSTAKWRRENPLAYSAHKIVQSARRNGSLVKSNCIECGSSRRVHAHHNNYGEPLTVEWLCHHCHMKRHAMLAERSKGSGQ